MVISPTIGRVVWFTPEVPVFDPSQPFAALVTYVHHDRMVNLVTFNHNGLSSGVTSVPLIQEGDEKPVGGFYCEWMPYQIGQAKKHAE